LYGMTAAVLYSNRIIEYCLGVMMHDAVKFSIHEYHPRNNNRKLIELDLLWAPLVVPIYSFVRAKRGVALQVFGS
jgi:hypothetical protein